VIGRMAQLTAPRSEAIPADGGLRQLRLIRFRSFEDFSISFGDGALLVGPNNAGKSTLLTAIRLADTLVRYAHRRNPDGSTRVGDVRVLTYPIQLRDYPSLRDSVRYEFGTAESRLELTWKSGSKLVAVWPEDSIGAEHTEPYFYLLQSSGTPVRSIAQAKSAFPAMGVVPVLGPIDHNEKLLDSAYVRNNIAGRLSSRHFRNQLRLLEEARDLTGFLSWASDWMGDLQFDRIQTQMSEEGAVVTAFVFEGASRVPKEMVWAGDGVQVWFQLLYHVHRVRNHSVIVLDEPEVYLHPDLQRRLVRLLESTGAQIVLATHSTELLAEADGRAAVLVDRSRRRGIRPSTEAQHDMLSAMLGTAFNLRIAKALRSRVAVFVEGRDMVVLRHFARRLGLAHVEREEGLSVIPLNGYTGWRHVEAFRWLLEEILPNTLKTFVVLDRDYRSDNECLTVTAALAEVGVVGHVWQRKELESYLITPSVISRLSGAPLSSVTEWIASISDGMGHEVFGRQLQERVASEVHARQHQVDVMSAFKAEFDEAWSNPEYRLIAGPPKQIIAALNRKLQSSGHKAVSVSGLARAHRVDEIAQEMREVLELINSAADNGR
jgi:energy-coupling factor transporter ATP-binding protein EcfA2